ncbi:PREDICTED: enhancer of split mgamma protein-like [Vollenhovia emeryi]|uniref:enhancer of split mgamma protein-like n=1 Tax=Vollenhovia emeryi TaxID=411798 RepID=UPI0005F528B8|nr:PREDICTED: enhancer of split mgamma protein-like [Vollenhovia emeryi]
MSFPPAMMSYDYPHPVSRTYQYKKITKPLLERKRRARINRCLDELKDLMVDALETEGENISKLEKADILELTVRHLQKLQASRPSGLSATIASGDEISAETRWQSGFGHCAAEACRFLSSLPGEAAEGLARHLAAGLQTGRQTNSPPKANLLSPTLANLDRIANIVAPCPVGTSGKIDSAILSANTSPIRSTPHADKTVGGVAPTTTVSSTPRCRASMSLVNGDEKLTVNCSAKPRSLRDQRSPTTTATTAPRNKTNDPHDINADDDEEIDVERVDDRYPMWRPW